MKFYSVEQNKLFKIRYYVIGEEKHGAIFGWYILFDEPDLEPTIGEWVFHKRHYNWKEVKLNKVGKLLAEKIKNKKLNLN